MNSDEVTTAALCAAVVLFTAWRIAVVRKRHRVLRELRRLLDESSNRGDDATLREDRTGGRGTR